MNVNKNDGRLKRDFYTVNMWKIKISRGHLYKVLYHCWKILLSVYYCASLINTRTINWHLRFPLPSIILTDLLGNRTLLKRVKRSRFVICDWWISIRFVCFFVSRFIACDRNDDWRQRKTRLWRRLLNFRIRVIVKSAVN